MDGYLLDTNIAIALLAGEHAALDFVRQASDDRMSIYFSVITECEVFSGLESAYRLQGIKLFNSRRCIEVSSVLPDLPGTYAGNKSRKDGSLKLRTQLLLQLLLSTSLVLYQGTTI